LSLETDPGVARPGTPAWIEAMAGRRPPRVAACLANDRWQALVTDRGAGVSSFGEHALTRWSGDPLEDREGFLLTLVDRARPARLSPSDAPVTFGPGTIAWQGLRDGLATDLAAAVHPALPVEIRRLVVRQDTADERAIEVSAAVEVVLHAAAADASHPAFSRLFVQTEWVAGDGALLARRRPRAAGESFPWLALALLEERAPEYESDRARYLGRVLDRARPRGLESAARWSGTTGNVLDPVLALRARLVLLRGEPRTLTFALVAGEDRAAVLDALARAREEGGGAILAAAAANGGRARANEEADLAGLGWTGPRAPADGPIDVADPFVPGSAVPVPGVPVASAAPAEANGDDLAFWNGFGGFGRDGREYVIRFAAETASAGGRPPQPWINVLANETFGALVSETGAGTTWSVNSRERRLTPWSNDPLLDPHGEALWLADRSTGEIVSPLPGPAAGEGACEVRHGFGVTRFHRRALGLECATTVFVPRHDPLKVTRLTVTNRGPAERVVDLAAYQRLVLGTIPAASAPTVVTAESATGDALFAHNPGDPLHPGRVAFSAFLEPGGEAPARTCDRAAFLGGSAAGIAAPLGLRAPGVLDGACGAGLDPCFAVVRTLRLAPGASETVTLVLGDAADRAEAEALLERWRRPGTPEAELAAVEAHWSEVTGAVRVETPAPGLDPLLNGWLVYQTIACRLWGRSAFYQSGGAFGFRDQLQDAAALLHYDPAPFREQILLHAAHQFVEGDVLHWWHPPDSRGLRTRFADDLLWLPWLAATYVRATGDAGVLDERVRFLVAPPLEPGEDEVFLAPGPAPDDQAASVYEHGARAIERSLSVGVGEHALPLFGSGDWNDGMNRVGHGGRGESVWMAFFLSTVLADFIPLCQARGDEGRAERFRLAREGLGTALLDSGGDGAWFRRGYYDDGTPLGSAQDDECRIDALVQAWAVISGFPDEGQVDQALDSLEDHLVDEVAGIVRLLDPPFEHTPHDPGYIKGYVPGVRENGGQYTHAAMWVVRAMAEAGRRDRAAHLLEMLSPVNHARTREQVATYQVEPYVVAADVYGAAPHVGRGGWTWYTGSSGWMIRVALESVLGVTIEDGRTLVVRPRIPDHWPGFTLRRRLPDGTTYAIAVVGAGGNAPSEAVVAATIDGAPAPLEGGAARIALTLDGATHEVAITLGPAAPEGPS
jgi:N,N'-diacetylchitobiose phosphorylase